MSMDLLRAQVVAIVRSGPDLTSVDMMDLMSHLFNSRFIMECIVVRVQ